MWLRTGAGLYADAGRRSADRDRKSCHHFRYGYHVVTADLDGRGIRNRNRYGNSYTFRNTVLSPYTDGGTVADPHSDSYACPYQHSYAGPYQHRYAYSHSNGAATQPDSRVCLSPAVRPAVRLSGTVLGRAGRVAARRV